MKFNNLNLGSDKKSEFTKADVKSTEMKESKDQMNYALINQIRCGSWEKM